MVSTGWCPQDGVHRMVSTGWSQNTWWCSMSILIRIQSYKMRTYLCVYMIILILINNTVCMHIIWRTNNMSAFLIIKPSTWHSKSKWCRLDILIPAFASEFLEYFERKCLLSSACILIIVTFSLTIVCYPSRRVTVKRLNISE